MASVSRTVPDKTQEGKCRTRPEQWSPTSAAHFGIAVIQLTNMRVPPQSNGIGLGRGVLAWPRGRERRLKADSKHLNGWLPLISNEESQKAPKQGGQNLHCHHILEDEGLSCLLSQSPLLRPP